MSGDGLELVRRVLRQPAAAGPPPGAAPPARFLDGTAPQPELARLGESLLREGRVAVLMPAGGLSTRMGGPGLRGDLVIGPVTDRTLFRLQGEKVAAIRARHAPRLPWLVMTSRAVHEATAASFRRQDFFGVAADDVWFFQQSSLPVLDARLEPVPLPDGTWLESPTGHGGLLAPLQDADLPPRLRRQGVAYLFSFQYPNVLEVVCDPVLLGYHHAEGFEVTTKGFHGAAPGEPVGRLVEVGGALRLVEYHVLDPASPPAAWWDRLPVNMATQVWSLSFLERCLDEGFELPYHAVPHRGAAVPLVKAEQWLGDLLPRARRAGLMLVDRETGYAVVKNASGPDSLETGLAALLRLYRSWLEQAGATPEHPDCRVEISPHFALDAADVRRKVRPGLRYPDGLVLS